MKKALWIPKPSCVGCAACANICPVRAILMQEDDAGFAYPSISDACIGCNACERACPVLGLPDAGNAVEPEVLVAWSKDEATRFCSTSGGLFTEFARSVIERGGVVIGAAYEEGAKAVGHSVAESEEGIAALRQSKYVQSSIGDSYERARTFLEESKEVLFCGAPCQVAGLRGYLGRPYDNLLAVEFVCRGVNSPKAYRLWLSEVELREGKAAAAVWFKYKRGGWKSSPLRTRVDFVDGSSIVLDGDENLFMKGYLGPDLYMRPCCGNCDFKGFPRWGDVTLADFWGIEGRLDDDKGASLVLLNNGKGVEAFERIAGRLHSERRTAKEAIAGNVCIYESAPLNPKSHEFLLALDSESFSQALAEFGRPTLLGRIRQALSPLWRKASSIAGRLASHGR